MKTPKDIVNVLSGLSARDRHWILARLSAKSRNALLAESSAKPVAAPTTGSKRLAQSLQLMATRLRGEPAWIIDASLQLCEAEQRAAVLRELPHAVRHEVERIAGTKRQHTARVTEFLARRLASESTVELPAETPSPFAKLVDRVSQRLATQRLRIRA